MAIDFPSDRATNDTYTYNNKTWLWNGEAWELSASTETGNTEGNTGEFAYYDVKGSVIKGATGFHYNATTLGISCAGVLYAGGGITSGDNLSVGTTIIETGGKIKSASSMDVVGNGVKLWDEDDPMLISNSNSTTINYPYNTHSFEVRGTPTSTIALYVDDNNNVGIGTNNPTESLDVRADSEGSGGGAIFGGKVAMLAGLSASGGATFSGDVTIRTAGPAGCTTTIGSNLTIRSAGDVALNLIADTDNVDENDNPLIAMGQDGGTGQFQLGVVGAGGQIFTNSLANAGFLNTGSVWNNLQFATNDTARMTILRNATKVGIGTTAPEHTLDIVGDLNVSAGVTFGDTVTITGVGDANLLLIADTDDSGEGDTPLINMRSDGGNHTASIGLVGVAGTYFTGSIADALFFEGGGIKPIQFANSNLTRQTIHADGIVQFHYGLTADTGATFGGPVQIYGGITASGGLYAAEGATFGADVNFKGNILLPDDGFIGVGAGDERILFDSNGNDMTMFTNTVFIPNKLSHSGDTDTYIAFTTDNVSLQAGGTDVLNIKTAGADFGDNAVLRPKLEDYSETVKATSTKGSSFNVDFEDGNVQLYLFNGELEVGFANPPASGTAGTVTLLILGGGANTTTWNSAVHWPGGNAPALSASGLDIVSFLTVTGGTTIYGFVGGINFSAP